MKKIVKITQMKKKRIELGLSQSDLAKVLKVATSTIGGYERGDNPVKAECQDKIAQVLKTSKSEIFKNSKTI